LRVKCTRKIRARRGGKNKPEKKSKEKMKKEKNGK
jgi:hypothetical protein